MPTPGPGFRPDLLERIFEPYFTTMAIGQGVGLGLDVARRIVVGLGGDLPVTSEPGDTVFAVRLTRTAERARPDRVAASGG